MDDNMTGIWLIYASGVCNRLYGLFLILAVFFVITALMPPPIYLDRKRVTLLLMCAVALAVISCFIPAGNMTHEMLSAYLLHGM